MSAGGPSWSGPPLAIRLAPAPRLALAQLAVHALAAAALLTSAIAWPLVTTGLLVLATSLGWHLLHEALRLRPRAVIALVLGPRGVALIERDGTRVDGLEPLALSPALLGHRLELLDRRGGRRVVVVPAERLDERSAHALRVGLALVAGSHGG